MDARISKILKHLQPAGVGVPTDIAPVLFTMYSNVNKMDQYQVFSTWGIIHSLLEDMKTEGLIRTEHILLWQVIQRVAMDGLIH